MAITLAKVNALPESLAPNTLYFVKRDESNLIDLYFSDNTGTATRHIATKEENQAAFIAYSDEAPSFPSPYKLWFNTEELSLHIQYNDGQASYWVEAIPSIAVPDFAGTGEANTMARSDHNHDEQYLIVGENDW